MLSAHLRAIAFMMLAAATASAQWTTNVAANTAIADLANDQAVPKVSARADGGCYIGWFDHSGSNYDLRLQRLDQNGYEAWPHNGIVVSNNPQASSLVDWDLITNYNGDAVLVFTDNRAGGDLDVYAYLIDQAGNSLWGANGIILSWDNEFEANPVVAEMSDATLVFAWNRSITGSNARIAYQKVDLLGQPLFPVAGLEYVGNGSDDPGFVGIAPAYSGAFILSWIRDTTPFSAPRHLWAQRFDASGVPQWGTAPVSVYDAAALPIAYKPEMQPDGLDGVFLAWYASIGSFFSASVQHLTAAGAEVFPHNGVEVSLEPQRSELYPSMVQLGGDLLVFYNKRNSGQTAWGIGGQRISSTGQLLWGTHGLELVPYDATAEEAPRAVPAPNGAMCFVEQGNFATTLTGVRVDGNGVAQWTPSPNPACTLASGKDKLRAIAASDGTAILVWNDSRVDSNNVYAQNVELDGSHGVPLLVIPYGCGWNPPGSLVVVGGTPSIGTTFTVGVTDPGASMAPGSIPYLAVAAAALPFFPCGFASGNIGLPAPGSAGEILIDPATLILPALIGTPWTAAPVAFPFPIPYVTAVVGVTVYLQGALIDPVSGRLGVTNGLVVRLGP
jgi:hypothetical protein